MEKGKVDDVIEDLEQKYDAAALDILLEKDKRTDNLEFK